ncbi:DUF4907 domain-containing protein [Winogradskyella psychrotolerans]|uniref:DUF4907 domain-containing protein n=1 Tax=Winogradskyella psychrotolerans TaxID=1344585 RepID=UPI001C06E032|nr:DUF4907 domain-containing protein [Winogradskyella psychrotolerans]MBU2929413.1 DUF4907 domain-containing protein [Winogradskyella psychrotolerans]
MKKIYNYKTVLLGIIILIMVFFYFQFGSKETNTSYDNNSFSLQVIEQDSSWIYEVYNEGSLFIRQEYIPAVKGRQGFTSKEDAEKIGNLVIRKLSEDKMPVISIMDLNAYAISYKKN